MWIVDFPSHVLSHLILSAPVRGEGPPDTPSTGGIMVERLMPDFGLDALPLAITSPGRRWPGPGPGEMVPSGLVPGAPPHIRGLTNFCHALPLVPGDVVETVPLDSEEGRSEAEYTRTWMAAGMPGQDRAEQQARQNKGMRRKKKSTRARRNQGWEDFANSNVYAPVVLTHVRTLIPGVLAIIDGCAEQSRREIAGPGVSGQLIPYGHAADRDDGILDDWWVDVESVFAAAGCDLLDTDGDRLFAFWGWRDCRDVVKDACLAAGLPAEHTRILDHDDRAREIGRYLEMDLVERVG